MVSKIGLYEKASTMYYMLPCIEQVVYAPLVIGVFIFIVYKKPVLAGISDKSDKYIRPKQGVRPHPRIHLRHCIYY